jgi:hypothetical protein
MSDHKNNASLADERLQRVISHQPYPLIFATISGAHLYGFPSPDLLVRLRMGPPDGSQSSVSEP